MQGCHLFFKGAACNVVPYKNTSWGCEAASFSNRLCSTHGRLWKSVDEAQVSLPYDVWRLYGKGKTLCRLSLYIRGSCLSCTAACYSLYRPFAQGLLTKIMNMVASLVRIPWSWGRAVRFFRIVLDSLACFLFK